jgi:hypothetical protein
MSESGVFGQGDSLMRIGLAIGGRSGGVIVLCRRQLLLDRFEIYKADPKRGNEAATLA